MVDLVTLTFFFFALCCFEFGTDVDGKTFFRCSCNSLRFVNKKHSRRCLEREKFIKQDCLIMREGALIMLEPRPLLLYLSGYSNPALPQRVFWFWSRRFAGEPLVSKVSYWLKKIFVIQLYMSYCLCIWGGGQSFVLYFRNSPPHIHFNVNSAHWN